MEGGAGERGLQNKVGLFPIPFRSLPRFAPLLQKRATMDDPSRVIVTASVAGLIVGTLGQHATFGYSASKGNNLPSPLPPPPFLPPTKLTPRPPPFSAAAIHLTRNLAVELGPRHILCNSIAPGFFPSKMTAALFAVEGGEAEFAQRHPNGRLGRAEDIAGVVVFLASRAAGHVNGACVPIDGGAMWAGSKM